jgi:hypothetical protein
MRLLNTDQRVFASRYTDAATFLRAANLRYECYVLLCNRELNPWGIARVKELLHAPACQEPWFVVQLRGDAPDCEEYLLEVGL